MRQTRSNRGYNRYSGQQDSREQDYGRNGNYEQQYQDYDPEANFNQDYGRESQAYGRMNNRSPYQNGNPYQGNFRNQQDEFPGTYPDENERFYGGQSFGNHRPYETQKGGAYEDEFYGQESYQQETFYPMNQEYGQYAPYGGQDAAPQNQYSGGSRYGGTQTGWQWQGNYDGNARHQSPYSGNDHGYNSHDSYGQGRNRYGNQRNYAQTMDNRGGYRSERDFDNHYNNSGRQGNRTRSYSDYTDPQGYQSRTGRRGFGSQYKSDEE